MALRCHTFLHWNSRGANIIIIVIASEAQPVPFLWGSKQSQTWLQDCFAVLAMTSWWDYGSSPLHFENRKEVRAGIAGTHNVELLDEISVLPSSGWNQRFLVAALPSKWQSRLDRSNLGLGCKIASFLAMTVNVVKIVSFFAMTFFFRVMTKISFLPVMIHASCIFINSILPTNWNECNNPTYWMQSGHCFAFPRRLYLGIQVWSVRGRLYSVRAHVVWGWWKHTFRK